MKSSWHEVEKNGQGLVEYAVIVALVAAIVVSILYLTGTSIKGIYCTLVKSLGGSATCQYYCQDSFNSLSNWSLTTNNAWAINSSGEMCNNTSYQTPAINTCSTQQNLPSDYVIDVNFAQLTAGNGYGVFFRLLTTNPINGYIFQFDPGLGNAFVYRKWVNGNETAPFATYYPPNTFNWGAAHTIKIVVQGSTFTTYIDNVQALVGSDSTYMNGGSVGFRVWDSTQVCFDNFDIALIP